MKKSEVIHLKMNKINLYFKLIIVFIIASSVIQKQRNANGLT